jgi:hypothetical protein
MFLFRPQPIAPGLLATDPWYRAKEDAAGRVVAESPPQYCPGHPERSAFYQLFQTHFDGYLRAYEERFSRDRDPCAPWLFDRSKTSCRAGDLKEVSIP